MNPTVKQAKAVKRLLVLLLAITSCNQIADIHEGFPRNETCSTLEDCKKGESECRKARACALDQCVYDEQENNTVLTTQVEGDCALRICEDGAVKVISDPTDVEDDQNECTLDRCIGKTPTHEPLSWASCYEGPVGTKDQGICRSGVRLCEDGQPVGGCMNQVLPSAETCLYPLDEDCDGQANEEGEGCFCGDGYPSVGEECDDGNADSTDGCTTSCTIARCGDGFVQSLNQENCDDGNTTSEDGCPQDCHQSIDHLVAGDIHACVLLHDGNIVKCWGGNTYGQLGLGDTQNRGDNPGEMGESLPPVDLGTGMKAIAIAAGSNHNCAILQDGSVKCWGVNDFGQLGIGDTATRGDEPNETGDNLPPVDLGTGMKAIAITAGSYHSCALLQNGSVKCWGRNTIGQLGLDDDQDRGDGPGEMGDALPTVDMGTGMTAISIAAGAGHTCALLQNGSVKCWGLNHVGQLGLGDTAHRGDQQGEMGDALATIDLGSGMTAISVGAGLFHTCALLQNGSVKCWGDNPVGQTGLGAQESRGDEPNEMGDNLLPVDLGTGMTVTSLSVGIGHNCAILQDKSVKCWGVNDLALLGLGDTEHRGDNPDEMGNKLPSVELGTGLSATELALGLFHTCARVQDDSVKCWGGNMFGQLGLGFLNDHRGDEPGEMGDNLPTVKLW